MSLLVSVVVLVSIKAVICISVKLNLNPDSMHVKECIIYPLSPKIYNISSFCCALVPPGSPSQPNVDKITKNSVDLSWNKPVSEGGAKPTGYVVEKKKKGEDWMECASVPGTATAATVTGLVEGEEYQFRVRAENPAGTGEPSKPTNAIIAADQPGERVCK